MIDFRQVPKRNSQGKISNSGNKSNKPGVRVSISVREDVKLHEAENAWKPARFNPSGATTDEEKKTEVSVKLYLVGFTFIEIALF